MGRIISSPWSTGFEDTVPEVGAVGSMAAAGGDGGKTSAHYLLFTGSELFAIEESLKKAMVDVQHGIYVHPSIAQHERKHISKDELKSLLNKVVTCCDLIRLEADAAVRTSDDITVDWD